MNKKGFTLVELIAVVVIISVIAMIATPNIISMMDKGKKEDYITNAKEFISKATYMYKLDEYNNLFQENRIYLKNIKDINNIEDPYGGSYDKENSYISFQMLSHAGIIERIPSIYLKSCDNKNRCHTIGTSDNPISKKELEITSIVESN